MWWEKWSLLQMCVLQTTKVGMEKGFEPTWDNQHGPTWPHRILNRRWATSRSGVGLKRPWTRFVTLSCICIETLVFSPLAVAASMSELAQPSRVNSKGSICCQSLRHGGGNENSHARCLCGEAAPPSPGFPDTRSQAQFSCSAAIKRPVWPVLECVHDYYKTI